MDTKVAVCRFRLFLQCLDYICCMCNPHTPQASERVESLCIAAPLQDDLTEKSASQVAHPQNSIAQEHLQTPLPQRKVKETSIIDIFPSGPPSHFPWQVIPLPREPAFFLTWQHEINPILRFNHRTEGYLRNPSSMSFILFLRFKLYCDTVRIQFNWAYSFGSESWWSKFPISQQINSTHVCVSDPVSPNLMDISIKPGPKEHRRRIYMTFTLETRFKSD